MIPWTEGIADLHRRVMRKDCHQRERISVSFRIREWARAKSRLTEDEERRRSS